MGRREEGQDSSTHVPVHAGICELHKHMQERTANPPSSSNTAVVPFILLSPLPSCEVSNFAQVRI